MNVLFITLVGINSIEDRGIYQDLLRKFRDEGHKVTILTPVERRKKTATNFTTNESIAILQVKTFNITKSNVLEKGIGTLAIEYQYLAAVKKYLGNQKYDLVLYSTPPITFSKVIQYIKKRDNAYTYLLLKDIFPQNAVDIGMLEQHGVLHRYFLKKEKELYAQSDTIGCMSPANVSFLKKKYPDIDQNKLEVNPNTIAPIELSTTKESIREIRERYDIPLEKKVFVYGGNLGKPQGLDFLLESISQSKQDNVYFLIVGDGTEFSKLKKWFEMQKPQNAKLLQRLPKDDYNKLLIGCDVGLIFLDKNFSIPNFPSRLLTYLEMKLPVLVASDPNTDMGEIVEANNCGLKVLAGDDSQMQQVINKFVHSDLIEMGLNSKKLLMSSYTVNVSYNLIVNKIDV